MSTQIMPWSCPFHNRYEAALILAVFVVWNLDTVHESAANIANSHGICYDAYQQALQRTASNLGQNGAVKWAYLYLTNTADALDADTVRKMAENY